MPRVCRAGGPVLQRKGIHHAFCWIRPSIDFKGATRSNGEINPNYTDTFVFDNDFPALFSYKVFQ